MNIESLRYFYHIAKAGNISSVARDMHISQSGLSQQIHKLENGLSKKLMERSNKGVSLTEDGKIVYKYAENILRTYDNMLVEITEHEKENIVLKVKACHSIADYAVPCTLMMANRKYPLHKYELSSGSTNEIINDISNNIADIGFTYSTKDLNIKDDEIVYVKIGANKLVLVAKNSTTVPDEISVERLLDSNMITFTAENEISDLLVKNLASLGYEKKSLKSNLEIKTIESAKTLVSKGHGYAFLPYISVKEELYKKEYKMIRVPEFDMNLEILMLFKKNYSEYVQEFIGWFIENGKNTFC